MSETQWLEVSLTVDGELAESVAEVLARFTPEGVVIESTAVTANADDSEGRSVGPLRVFGYLPVDQHLETARQRLEEALWYLGRICPLPEAQFRLVQQSNWAEAWKEHFPAVEIGESLVVLPSWLEATTSGRLPIRIDPGMAFGTGTHPTTQICLEIIEEIFRSPKKPGAAPLQVIDLGCGSGILAIAALKLGASRALAVDIDPEAIRAAQANAELNAVAQRLEIGCGSLVEISSHAFSIQKAPLVLVNILAPVIVRLLHEGLGQLVSEGGNLVLSGILEEQAAEVEAALEENGFSLIEKRQSGDWVALWARPRPTSGTSSPPR